jgi:hypothetical protein
MRTYGYVLRHLYTVGEPLRLTDRCPAVGQPVIAPVVVVALGTQTQPRTAPLVMVAAQKRAEMPSCPAIGCRHAPQGLSASGMVVSAEKSVLVGLGTITLLTCLSSVYSIGGRRGPWDANG